MDEKLRYRAAQERKPAPTAHPLRLTNPRCITIIRAAGQEFPTPALRFRRWFVPMINQRGRKRPIKIARWLTLRLSERRWQSVLDDPI